MSRWRQIARDGWFTDIVFFLFPTHPSGFCFEFSLSCLSYLFPSFYPLTTWAATLCYCHMSECQPPHHSSLWLARPFQVGELLPDNNLVWLLEQRCNWLICSPCLGLGFWSSLVCVWVCVLKWGVGWLLSGAPDKHTCTHIPRLTTQITHTDIYWHTLATVENSTQLLPEVCKWVRMLREFVF